MKTMRLPWSSAVNPTDLTDALLRAAIADSSSRYPIGLSIAAVFDLLASARFFDSTTTQNWVWCEAANRDFYPHLNACPFCSLQGRFVHLSGQKPPSGTIGPATAGALRNILAGYCAIKGGRFQVCQGIEPIDVAIVDASSRSVLIAEVKASPLFVPPLAIPHTAAQFAALDKKPLNHVSGYLRSPIVEDMAFFYPDRNGQPSEWPIGRIDLLERGWATNALLTSIKSGNSPFKDYLDGWLSMWSSYISRNRSSPAMSYWLTGACGTPTAIGEGWPTDSSGRPRGSISDSKTSVGIDRTDDIKKSLYQILEMGVKLRPSLSSDWRVYIGLASNLHAARHYDDYLAQFEDVVWAYQKGAAPPSEWYNLVDGIIAFSESFTKSEWLKEVADWHN